VPPQLITITASSTVIVPAQGGPFADTRPTSAQADRWIEAKTTEADDRFAFSVRAGRKDKGFAWSWAERVHPGS
jgi:hypothetical protein